MLVPGILATIATAAPPEAALAACEARDFAACVRATSALRESHPDTAAQLASWACARDHAPSCVQWGTLAKRPHDARAFLRACDLGNAEGCRRAMELEKQTGTAIAPAWRGCALGDATCCAQLDEAGWRSPLVTGATPRAPVLGLPTAWEHDTTGAWAFTHLGPHVVAWPPGETRRPLPLEGDGVSCAGPGPDRWFVDALTGTVATLVADDGDEARCVALARWSTADGHALPLVPLAVIRPETGVTRVATTPGRLAVRTVDGVAVVDLATGTVAVHAAEGVLLGLSPRGTFAMGASDDPVVGISLVRDDKVRFASPGATDVAFDPTRDRVAFVEAEGIEFRDEDGKLLGPRVTIEYADFASPIAFTASGEQLKTTDVFLHLDGSGPPAPIVRDLAVPVDAIRATWPTGEVTGTVRVGGKKAAAVVRLELELPVGERFEAQAEAGRDGTFRFDAVPRGAAGTLDVRADRARERLPITTTSGVLDVDLAYGPPTYVRVVGSGGQAVRDARVTCRLLTEPDPIEAAPEGDVFRCRALPAEGVVEIRAERGEELGTWRGEVNPAIVVPLLPPQDASIVRATIVTDGFAPVPGATVAVPGRPEYPSVPQHPRFLGAPADAAGGWSTVLTPDFPSYMPVNVAGVTAAEMKLFEVGGDPVPTSRIDMPSGHMALQPASTAIHERWSHYGDADRVLVPAGTWAVRRCDAGRCGSAEITVAPGETRVAEFPLDGAVGALVGRVQDDGGNPIAQVGVAMQCLADPTRDLVRRYHPPEEKWPCQATTGPSGRFRIEGLEPGPHDVYVWGSETLGWGMMIDPVEVPAGEARVVIDRRTPGDIRLRRQP